MVYIVDSGSTVTVVEDDESEKADGVRVVETGSAKPLKPVVQSANNNQQQQEQQQPAAPAQAQQPLSTNNANNAQQQTSGQPLTVQQPGQQPPVRIYYIFYILSLFKIMIFFSFSNGTTFSFEVILINLLDDIFDASATRSMISFLYK